MFFETKLQAGDANEVGSDKESEEKQRSLFAYHEQSTTDLLAIQTI